MWRPRSVNATGGLAPQGTGLHKLRRVTTGPPMPVDSSIAEAANFATRRAWFVLLTASTVFALLAVGAFWGARWVYRHATTPETARLEMVSGSGALIRSPADSDWRLVTSDTVVREGDTVSTTLGTVVRLIFFDGSTAEIAEDSIVSVSRMRSSRFLDRTKLLVLEPVRGTVEVGMMPRGEHDYSEFIVRAGGMRVVMSGGDSASDTGAFVVEVHTERAPTDDVFSSARVAVLRGTATVFSTGGSARLNANQQTIVADDGAISPIAAAVRELVRNGDFARGLGFWTEVAYLDGDAIDVADAGASVALVPDHATRADVVALEFKRESLGHEIASTGIRQHIGQSLRAGSSLLLLFEVWIDEHRPLSGGNSVDTFPLTIEIDYVDEAGDPQRWRHGYFVSDDPAVPVPNDVATRLDATTWQRVAFDLRNLNPRPRQITSVLVYASGTSYRTRVTNLSLTSNELVERIP
jgi:hypothetical protein